MPDGEVQGDALADEEPDVDGALEFHGNARARLEACADSFKSDLTHASRQCAQNDQCDAVSVKHVNTALRHVCSMGVGDDPARVNPHIWWLAAGIFFAVALAIPDAGAMIFGSVDHEPVHWAWYWLVRAFSLLIFLGLLSFSVAFLLALGPYQPKWFKATKTALAKLSSKR